MAEGILKRCAKCDVEKPTSDFYRHSSGHLRGQCKACVLRRQEGYVISHSAAVSDYKKRWSEENAARIKESKKLKYCKNAKEAKEKAAEYSKANPERVKSYKTKWKRDNPHKVREYSFVRGRTQRAATPSWANRSAMVAMYRKARELTKSSGVEHHVDHIVPIRSAIVSGLHCEANMQILEARSNISKLNRWWPDMW